MADPNWVFANKYYDLSTELESVDVEASAVALRESRDYALKGGYFKLVARAEYNLSNRFNDMGLLDSAEYDLNSALVLTYKFHFEELFPSMILGSKGDVLAQEGMFDSASITMRRHWRVCIHPIGKA